MRDRSASSRVRRGSSGEHDPALRASPVSRSASTTPVRTSAARSPSWLFPVETRSPIERPSTTGAPPLDASSSSPSASSPSRLVAVRRLHEPSSERGVLLADRHFRQPRDHAFSDLGTIAGARSRGSHGLQHEKKRFAGNRFECAPDRQRAPSPHRLPAHRAARGPCTQPLRTSAWRQSRPSRSARRARCARRDR